MIFVDASALTAALRPETGSEAILRRFEIGGAFFTSPVAVYEAVMAVARISNSTINEARQDVFDFLEIVPVNLMPMAPAEATTALGACARFGKGRHRARLNMGDCFSYAAAKAQNAAILFVGDDFSHTDLKSALPAA